MLNERQPAPEEVVKTPQAIEVIRQSIPLNQDWLTIETKRGVETIPLYNRLDEGDIKTIAQTLGSDAAGIDVEKFAAQISERYRHEGSPSHYKEIANHQSWDAHYIKFLNDALNFVTTVRYLDQAQKGRTIREHDTINVVGSLTDEQKSVPFERRWGLQNNIEFSLLDKPEFSALHGHAREILNFSQVRSKQEELTLQEDQDFLTKKFNLEREYFRVAYNL